MRGEVRRLLFLIALGGLLTFPFLSAGQSLNLEGWPVPDLTGLIPYSMTIEMIGGIEKIVEKFYIPGGGHVARIRGEGKVFGYAVDNDREPPIDYLLLDFEGSGKFVQKFGPADFYFIPEWVSE